MLLRTSPLPSRREGPQAGHCCAPVLPQDIPTLIIFFLEEPRKRGSARNPERVRGTPRSSPRRKEPAASKRGMGAWDKKNRSQGISWDLGQAGDQSSSCPMGKGRPRPRGPGEGPPLTGHSHNDTPACSGPCVKAPETQREQQESLSLGRSQLKAGLRAC